MFNSVISFGLVINSKSYAKLPPEYKKLIDSLGTKEAAVDMATKSWGKNAVLDGFMAKQKINNVKMTADAEKAMRAAAQKVVDGRIAAADKKGLPASKVYAEIKALAAKYSK